MGPAGGCSSRRGTGAARRRSRLGTLAPTTLPRTAPGRRNTHPAQAAPPWALAAAQARAAAAHLASPWSSPWYPGTTGTPAAAITALARALSPIARIAAAGGPTKRTPAAAQASAKGAFSDRKPYLRAACEGEGRGRPRRRAAEPGGAARRASRGRRAARARSPPGARRFRAGRPRPGRRSHPGWIASAPDRAAAASTASTLR
jgi:hypothetical protein